uniref:Sulfide:quinone oxidoreductase, mitochondrial n=1 Tax=Ciona intestinalis TaxID=7719 RepID=F6QTS6_CIOIN|nr:sulfide:quinone oxidoreductase, mitochondrial [Ciona intestinalis]|eukprot:XP_002129153.1 sulfide:quinone oxidoreductase, mitochondrial [Ciona intestinalis]
MAQLQCIRNTIQASHKLARQTPFVFACRGNASYEVLVAGGGTGGISSGARLANKLGKGKVAIVEPADNHYYQPLWTLVGAGAKPMSSSQKSMKDVIPPKATWIKDSIQQFDPENNQVILGNGEKVSYKYLVVALGIKLQFDRIKGLPEAFDTPGVCSNYSAQTVGKTLEALQDFTEGNAIFTFPTPPLKCPGAPQKIMYLADEYLRKHGKRDKATVMFNSAGPSIFAVKKYAESLSKVVASKDIVTNFGLNLVEVKPETKEAIFQKVANPEELVTYKYEMLHVSPPMSPHEVVKTSGLADAAGFVEVNKETMQHVRYPNVFSLGDCSSVPTSKTAAAVASQNAILSKNLLSVMSGGQCTPLYDGYTSCPLITGYSKCILAEFDFDLAPLETFPLDQGKQRRSMYHMKADVMPAIYWDMMLKGRWSGPKQFRKAMHLGMSR